MVEDKNIEKARGNFEMSEMSGVRSCFLLKSREMAKKQEARPGPFSLFLYSLCQEKGIPDCFYFGLLQSCSLNSRNSLHSNILEFFTLTDRKQSKGF
jgi:hypothetical protein